MAEKQISSAAYVDSKPHYENLDGLRGVAALLVVWYHIYECFPIEHQWFNHGYLAVDFFFILSGFVIGYAYDDRWNKMSMGDFFKRRLVRLHPMVIMGVILGTITFCIQGAEQWDGTKISISMIMVAMLMNMFMIPNVPGASCEVRGNGEMFPLNGPSWSLFFEYIANIMYAIFLRRLSNKALVAFTCLSGLGLLAFAIADMPGYGSLGVGWTLADGNLLGGLLRVTFPFSAGLLLSRKFRPMMIRGAFWVCSAMILALLIVPFISVGESTLFNRLYDTACILFFFPMIVYLGASGKTTDKKSSAICKFLGDISFPLYMVHYPFMYLFYDYIGFPNTFRVPADTWPYHLLLFFGNIALAYLCLKLYDEPVRKYLAKKWRIGK